MEVREGYKLTEVGVLPDEWDAVSLGDCCSKIGSGITPTGGEKVYLSEGRPFIRSQNIGWGNLILDDVVFIDEDTHRSFDSTEIKLEDVFINITGASIGRSAIADSRIHRGNVNQHVCIIRTEKNKLVPKFLNQFLLSKDGQKQVDSFQGGGNRQGLNFGQIKTFKVPLPPTKAEQTAIATALSDADALIQSLEKLIAKKQAIKQGAMQLLLTGKQRLPGFSGEWEVKKLGEIGKPYGGLSGKSKIDFQNGKYSYIPFMNIMSNPKIKIEFLGQVHIKAGEFQNQALRSDLFFNGSSETPDEVGMCSVLLDDFPNLYLNSFCFGFRLFQQAKCNPLYLAYYFRSEEGRKMFYSLAQGATRYNLSKHNFLKLSISLPCYEEQTEIAKVSSDMDEEILGLQQKLSKYRQIKQGMMQELLTGKTRLV